MRVNEAVKKTGLTKKAIRYYEEKGLVCPRLNSTNGYKDYSEKNIDDLQTIAFLRNIHMSVTQIKEYLSNIDKREELLSRHFDNLDNKIQELEAAKEAIKTVLSNKATNLNELSATLNSYQLQYKDYVLKRLTASFPDAYGKYLLLHFGPFLNEPLDNEEKKKSFNEIVEFLDDVNTIEFPKEWCDYLELIDEEELIKSFTNMNNRLIELSNTNIQDQKEMDKIKGDVESYLKHRESIEGQEVYEQMRSMMDECKRSFEKSGYYDKFVKNLKVISLSYKEYTEKIEKVNEALGLEYDENNNMGILK